MTDPSTARPIDTERQFAGERRSAVGENLHHRHLWPVVAALLPDRPSNVLDVACGNGFLASRMAQSGHHVTAFDLSAENIASARKSYPQVRFEVASAYDDLSDLRPPAGWDTIVAVEIIAHLFSPQRFLTNMRGNLAENGRIIVTAPYHGYVKNVALSVLGQFDKHFEVYFEGGHIKFFSRRSLDAMFAAAGFRRPSFRYAGRVPLLWKSMVCWVDDSRKTPPPR
jgi:2-polyprenyl-3-methyl-5-hydroxy-6-metoxy-1,4-benzoquinol methylase